MRNHAEEIAFWYYRLNYFFLLTNFVMHQVEETERRRESSEIDILAIKPPYATESIPTDEHYKLQPDPKLISLLGITPICFDESTIYVMAEISCGGTAQRDRFRSIPRLIYNLRRLGLHKILNPNSLQGIPMKKLGNIILCKIFSGIEATEPSVEEDFFVIPLKHADGFVEARMSKNFKGRDWYLFNSNYIQSKIMFRQPE